MDKALAIIATISAVALGASMIKSQLPPVRKDPLVETDQLNKTPHTLETGETTTESHPKVSRSRSISTDSAGAGITAADLGGA